MYRSKRRSRDENGKPGLLVSGRAARVLAAAFNALVLSMGSAHAAPAGQDSAKESPFDSKRLTDADGLGVRESELPASRIFPEQMPSGSPEEDLRASAGAGLDVRASAAAGLDLRASAGAGLANVVKQATKMIGISYLWGGNNPKEGLERLRSLFLPQDDGVVVAPAVGADQQDGACRRAVRPASWRSGIYMGGQRFIHAPKTGAHGRDDGDATHVAAPGAKHT